MKKTIILSALCVAMLTSCNNGAKQAQQELENEKAIAAVTREELQTALSERDELLDIINGITSDLDDIRSVEKVITINGTGEANSRTEISNSLQAIKATLADRRQRLNDLESKLKDSKLSNSKLLTTIENLKGQIDQQEAQIKELSANLDAAHKRIGELDSAVDSLTSTVKTVTDERNTAQEEAIAQANLANECYYAIGSKKELKEHGILESGFLRKTKIMQGDFDKSYFIKADKRTLSTITLHSNKAKIVTSAQPAGSYSIVDVNGDKVLRITNPQEFWGVSNYVVIQID